MSQSIPIRMPAYRLVFPPPAYCAYTGGAIPVPSNDHRPATETNAYPKVAPTPVNPPPPKVVHVEDVVPVVPVVVSPYPASTYQTLSAPKVVHVADPEGSRRRGKVIH